MRNGVCTVCLEPLFKDLQVAQCGHVFHRTCIFRWIDRSCSCPNCKQHLDASELTTLFLKPAEIIKEVLGDPTVLEDADPELLLAITKAQCGSDDDDDDSASASDPDTDLELLDLSASKPKSSKSKKKRAKNKMALISEKIRSTALNRKAEDLEAQLNALTVTHRAMEEAKAKLHRKIQGYLKSAQTYEKRYFDADDEVKNLTRQLFRKNKEMNELKRAVESMAQRMAMLSHAEQILAGNFDAVRREEETAERSRSKEEQERYYRSMYDWLLKEYKRCQSDRERDKKLTAAAGKKWAGTFEEQRVKIEEMMNGCMAGDAKVERYKKAYFDLKDKYKKLRERAREMNRELKELRLGKKGDSNNSVGVSVGVEHGVEVGVEELNMAHVASSDHGQSGALAQIQPAHTHEKEQKREHSVSRSYDDENAPQLDISRVHDDQDREDKYNAMSLSQPTPVSEVTLDDGVFGIPSEDGMGGFRRDTASLFGAYRQIKSRGGGSNPFSNGGGAAANRKKRSFSQLSKGNDGRGGTASFMKSNINTGNQRASKRRRVVSSSSSSSNSNSSGNVRSRGGGNGKQTSNKGSVSKFFDRFMK